MKKKVLGLVFSSLCVVNSVSCMLVDMVTFRTGVFGEVVEYYRRALEAVGNKSAELNEKNIENAELLREKNDKIAKLTEKDFEIARLGTELKKLGNEKNDEIDNFT
jgi:rRNA maturation endonuclease Nob1